MSKSTTILNFFKRKNPNNSEVVVDDARLPTPSVESIDVPVSENLQTEVPNATWPPQVQILVLSLRMIV